MSVPTEGLARCELPLAYASLGIRIESASRPPLAWLSEFLTPAFDRDIERAPRHRRSVALVLDPARYEQVAHSQPPNPSMTDCFMLDHRFARYPAWFDGCRRVILDERSQSLYVSDAASGAVTVLAERDTPHVRRGLLRVVREIATAGALREGCLHLHASAVHVSGRIVAFAGPRLSGKTTLMLHALTSGGVEYVTSDRLMVGPGRTARGMPTLVSLRDDTLERFPEIRARIVERRYAGGRTKGESSLLRAHEVPHDFERLPDGRLQGLSPAQLCDVTGASAAGSGPLALIVLPRIVPGVSCWTLRELPPDAAATRIRESLFLSAIPERTPAAFDPGLPPFCRTAAALDALSAELSLRISCIELQLGMEGLRRSAGDGRALTAWQAILSHLP